jgi:hypothetical protein
MAGFGVSISIVAGLEVIPGQEKQGSGLRAQTAAGTIVFPTFAISFGRFN